MAVYNVLPETNLKVSDVRDTLNAGRGKVGNNVTSFYTKEANINPWAKYKPVTDKRVVIPPGDVSWWKGENSNGSPGFGNCNISYKSYRGIDALKKAYENKESSWEYVTIPMDYPKRLGDFRNYFKDAKSFVYGTFLVPNNITEEDIDRADLYILLGCSPNNPNLLGVDEFALAAIKNLGDCHFGIARDTGTSDINTGNRIYQICIIDKNLLRDIYSPTGEAISYHLPKSCIDMTGANNIFIPFLTYESVIQGNTYISKDFFTVPNANLVELVIKKPEFDFSKTGTDPNGDPLEGLTEEDVRNYGATWKDYNYTDYKVNIILLMEYGAGTTNVVPIKIYFYPKGIDIDYNNLEDARKVVDESWVFNGDSGYIPFKKTIEKTAFTLDVHDTGGLMIVQIYGPSSPNSKFETFNFTFDIRNLN